MKEAQALVRTAAVLAVAVVALLTVWFARHGSADMPRPSETITQQSVVTAPPVPASPEAAARSTAMGGPPAPAHASR